MKTKYKISGYILSSLVMFQLFQGANIPKVIKKSEDKVVKIGIVLKDGRMGSGSGAIVDWDGSTLTCAHVVSHKGLSKIFVKFEDGRVYRAEISKINQYSDLVLLKLVGTKPFQRFNYFRLGQEVEKGQQVILFGAPLGIQGCVTVGWVENMLEDSFNLYHAIILYSAFTNPGNSGGPLVDLHGRLVGLGEGVLLMNPFIPASGLFYAIDIEVIREFLELNG